MVIRDSIRSPRLRSAYDILVGKALRKEAGQAARRVRSILTSPIFTGKMAVTGPEMRPQIFMMQPLGPAGSPPATPAAGASPAPAIKPDKKTEERVTATVAKFLNRNQQLPTSNAGKIGRVIKLGGLALSSYIATYPLAGLAATILFTSSFGVIGTAMVISSLPTLAAVLISRSLKSRAKAELIALTTKTETKEALARLLVEYQGRLPKSVDQILAALPTKTKEVMEKIVSGLRLAGESKELSSADAARVREAIGLLAPNSDLAKDLKAALLKPTKMICAGNTGEIETPVAAGLTRTEERKDNEDGFSIYSRGSHTLLLVADGMGGHANGEVASTMALEHMNIDFAASNGYGDYSISQAVQNAHQAIVLQKAVTLSNMGTTVVAAMIKGNKAQIGAAGDSPYYIMRNGRFLVPGESETQWKGKDNKINCALGFEIDKYTETGEIELQEGDILILASDGLNGFIDKDKFLATIEANKGKTNLEIARALADATESPADYAKDNMTIVVYKHKAVVEAKPAGPQAAAAPQPQPAAPAGVQPTTIKGDNGTYIMKEKVGSGGMGAVYKAARVVGDKETDQLVAIKLLTVSAASTAKGQLKPVERLRQEIEVLFRFQHPNVVKGIDQGVAADGQPFIVMEFLEGQTFKQFLAINKKIGISRMDAPVAVDYCSQVAGALAEANKAGIVHRDIKPDNIFIVQISDGRGGTKSIPILTDFGLAKDVTADGLTTAPSLMGTHAYMAPDLLEFSSRDPNTIAPAEKLARYTKADIYALGVVLYEMLTGKKPFPIKDFSKDFVPYAQGRTKHTLEQDVIPDALFAVVTRMLAFDHNNRYVNFDVVVAALAGALRADQDKGKPVDPQGPTVFAPPAAAAPAPDPTRPLASADIDLGSAILAASSGRQPITTGAIIAEANLALNDLAGDKAHAQEIIDGIFYGTVPVAKNDRARVMGAITGAIARHPELEDDGFAAIALLTMKVEDK